MAKRITRERFMTWASATFCSDGVWWLRRNKLTPRQAWDRCRRPSWMIWPLIVCDIERFGGPAHLAAAEKGWNRKNEDYAINPVACAAIRKAIPWRHIAKRLAEVIGN